MAENAGNKSSRRVGYFSIAAWVFVVSCGVVDIVAHRGRMDRFDWFSTILMILAGIMCIFIEVMAVIRGPQ